jgi:hypothetical protein
MRGTPERPIFDGFVRSPERRRLDQEGRAPTIKLPVAFADAVQAGRDAARQPMVRPAGPLALRKSGHAERSPGVILPFVLAGPQRAARA